MAAQVERSIVALPRPVEMSGEVVKGFGRGSKMLGIPTANLPQDSLAQLPDDFKTGIYFGWATVDGAGPFKMVSSVGWNPYFNNKTKTVEPHLLHEFPDDFYGATIRIVLTGYLRPELNFDGLDALITAINDDIAASKEALDRPEHARSSTRAFLRAKNSNQTWGGSKTFFSLVGAAAVVGALFVYLRRTK